MVHGDATNASVDVLDSSSPTSATAVQWQSVRRGDLLPGLLRGGHRHRPRLGQHHQRHQKGGIVANGPGTDVQIQENTVTGLGPVGYIAQNGIQIGYGANATMIKNSVSAHSYTGTSTVSGGIVVVGGPGYRRLSRRQPVRVPTNTKIIQNVVTNNDVGIFLTNLAPTERPRDRHQRQGRQQHRFVQHAAEQLRGVRLPGGHFGRRQQRQDDRQPCFPVRATTRRPTRRPTRCSSMPMRRSPTTEGYTETSSGPAGRFRGPSIEGWASVLLPQYRALPFSPPPHPERRPPNRRALNPPCFEPPCLWVPHPLRDNPHALTPAPLPASTTATMSP